MAYLRYKDHTILSAASIDLRTGMWTPVASISWCEGDNPPSFHLLCDSVEEVLTSIAAERRGKSLAMRWVDRRIESKQD